MESRRIEKGYEIGDDTSATHRIEQARSTFSLSNYAVTSGITALVTGIVRSTVIMLFLWHRPATP
jgi:hypothetical protein